MSVHMLLSLALAGGPVGQLSFRPDPARPPASVNATRLSSTVTMDGALTEPIWQRAAPIENFSEKNPTEGATPSQRTVVRIAYDDEAIYIGAELFDTAPDSIRAPLSRRDHFASADRFTVFLDPYHDKRTGFFFGVTAAGTLIDGTLYNDDWDDDTWDGVWDAKVRRTASGWTVEMRIPYSQLRFAQRASYQWGINFRRDIARYNEDDWLVYTPKSGSGFVSRFPVLDGLTGITPPRRLEVLPYVTTKAAFLQHAAGNPFNDGSQITPNVGADVKVGVGGNLTLDGTINPDFGQVEVDPAVVNLSDVESYFDEKRPFFVEGANIFSFGHGGANDFWGFNNPEPELLYTRRIGRAPELGVNAPDGAYVSSPEGTHILGAGKLSGKLGSWSLGTLGALTRAEYARMDVGGTRSRALVEPLSYYGATRMLKEFNQGKQGLGVLATTVFRDNSTPEARAQLGSSATVFAVDGWTQLAHGLYALTGQVGYSRVGGTPEDITALQRNSVHYFQRPDASEVALDPAATSMSGLQGRFTLNKQRGRFFTNTALGFVSPGFDANDIGFQWTSDVINVHQVVGYRWNKPTDWYRSINVNATYVRNWNFGGAAIHNMLWTRSNIMLTNFNTISLGANYLFDRMTDRATRGGPLMVNPGGLDVFGEWQSDDRKPVTLGLNFDFSRFKHRSDRSWDLSGSVEWKPADRLSISVEPAYAHNLVNAQYIAALDDPSASATYGKAYVFAALNQTTVSSDVRVNLIFNPRTSLEVYAQPLISSGRYTDFKQLAAPSTYDFVAHDPVGNPDFTFTSLRGNAVFRWEYRPGSALYLVWTQTRSAADAIGDFRLGHSAGQLFSAKADNIFLLKFSYWLNP